jgi:hypothetical protein
MKLWNIIIVSFALISLFTACASIFPPPSPAPLDTCFNDDKKISIELWAFLYKVKINVTPESDEDDIIRFTQAVDCTVSASKNHYGYNIEQQKHLRKMLIYLKSHPAPGQVKEWLINNPPPEDDFRQVTINGKKETLELHLIDNPINIEFGDKIHLAFNDNVYSAVYINDGGLYYMQEGSMVTNNTRSGQKGLHPGTKETCSPEKDYELWILVDDNDFPTTGDAEGIAQLPEVEKQIGPVGIRRICNGE